MTLTQSRIFEASSSPEIAESGGAHNQKGVDFQRYWTISRAFELEADGADNFLFLIETVQDVLELNSADEPSAANIYQVKKKDSGEWTWKELTNLDGPPKLNKDGTPRKRRQSKTPGKVPSFQTSPIGKLALSVGALSPLPASAHFVSNAGCTVPLNLTGISNASSAQTCTLSVVESNHAGLLDAALATLATDEGAPIPSTCLYLRRTTVNPDAPEALLISQAHDLLVARSPKHASQARTLIRALFVTISPKGRQTGLCGDFAELRRKRGFAKSDLCAALANLECVPDIETIRADWLLRLTSEGLGVVEHSRVVVALSQIDRERLSGLTSDAPELVAAIAEWVKAHEPAKSVYEFLKAGDEELRPKFPYVSKARLYALLLMDGVTEWVLKISED